ncbi:hypothetical protein L195_g057688, partial [Trifolium pratense]
GCVGTDKILNGNGNGVKNYLLMRINSCMNSRIYYKASPFIRIDLIGSVGYRPPWVIQQLWKNNVPSKINIFGWRLLLEKLPTRASLNHRECGKQFIDG